MRLALLGVDAPGALATSLAGGARALGHEATVLDTRRLTSGWAPLRLVRRAGVERVLTGPLVGRLLARLERLEPDLVLIVKGRFVGRKGVNRLRLGLACPVLNYYPDHPLWPGQDEPQVLESLHAYDEVVVWGQDLADALEHEGLKRVRVVPFGYDPQVYRPPPGEVEPRWDAAFVGQCYPGRLRAAEALADRTLLLSGLGWARAAAGGPLEGRTSEESFDGPTTCSLYWASRVGVNVLGDWNVPAHNMRTFEVPASGTAMVATRTPEHELLFGDDGALLVDGPDEARDAVLTLVDDEELRERVATTGRERVRPHTYSARMEALLEPWRR